MFQLLVYKCSNLAVAMHRIVSDNRLKCKDISIHLIEAVTFAPRPADMKASSGALLATAVAFAALAATALATNYKVGGADLWETYTNYDDWTEGKTFMVGDTIGAYLLLEYFSSPLHPFVSVDRYFDQSLVKNQCIDCKDRR